MGAASAAQSALMAEGGGHGRHPHHDILRRGKAVRGFKEIAVIYSNPSDPSAIPIPRTGRTLVCNSAQKLSSPAKNIRVPSCRSVAAQRTMGRADFVGWGWLRVASSPV